MTILKFSTKIIATSAAIFTSSITLHHITPQLTNFLTEIPRFSKSISSWLTPPYLYFIINCIIISIAATSRFQKNISPDFQSFSLLSNSEEAENVSEDSSLFLVENMDLDEGFVISRSSWSPKKREFSGAEKPTVSTRLGRRKSSRASPEGKALRVARPRKQETLENTWRTITDGRPVPLARHLKKADTWDTHTRATATESSMLSSPTMRKSESVAFPPSAANGLPSPKSSSRASPLSSGRIRREPSLGQDDLNRRVEAFINKFNEDMRLQRQQSLQQYMNVLHGSGQ